jgi:hypothetical protein
LAFGSSVWSAGSPEQIHTVILSEAKDLWIRSGDAEVFRFAQDDNSNVGREFAARHWKAKTES